MNADLRSAGDGDGLMENFAAELTETAFVVALRQAGRSWLELKLDLWRAISETLKENEVQT